MLYDKEDLQVCDDMRTETQIRARIASLKQRIEEERGYRDGVDSGSYYQAVNLLEWVLKDQDDLE